MKLSCPNGAKIRSCQQHWDVVLLTGVNSCCYLVCMKLWAKRISRLSDCICEYFQWKELLVSHMGPGLRLKVQGPR